MEEHQKEFARVLAETGALFFAHGLWLKDGRTTPYFINLGLFRTGRLSVSIGSFMADMLVSQGFAGKIDVLVGPSYKGSALAVSTAQALWTNHQTDILFDYNRKEAKTHGEATGQESMFVTNSLYSGARLFIVDDVATSMGTKYDIIKLINAEATAKKIDLSIVGVGIAVDREQTTAVKNEKGLVREGVKGQDAIGRFTAETGIPVFSILGIRQTVRYLAEEEIPLNIDGVKRPLDASTLRTFEKYMDTYGVENR